MEQATLAARAKSSAKADNHKRNAGEKQTTTMASRAYNLLRNEIIEGALAPGTPLRLEVLKERYGQSFSPIREALNRLNSEKLVQLTALRGFRVAEISVHEMWDAIETRVLIDSAALELSILKGNDDWEASVVGAFHALSKHARRIMANESGKETADYRELEARHRDFHVSLISANDSKWLTTYSAQLYDQTERYRRLIVAGGDEEAITKRNVPGEHQAIMDATLARDTTLATQLLSEHYRRTGQFIENNFPSLRP
jgi:DNA-binding GntR family transcriptional regulator